MTGAEVISLQRERIRRRIRRRLRELREAEERDENDPAAEERNRRITEIAEIVIEEVMGQSPAARNDGGGRMPSDL